MKRSDMIEKLDLILNSKLYQDYQFSTEEISDLLKEIEMTGMLPPMSNETMSQHNLSTVEAMLDSVMYDFKWDKEDEEK
jgi:hypothetical protein